MPPAAEWNGERVHKRAGEDARSSPNVKQRVCVLVLGMHRSGTSALTRVFNLLGGELPKNLLGANAGNETGHWEPERLINLHDRMLTEAGSRWDDWRAFDPKALPKQRSEFYRSEIRRILEEEYGDAPLIVLKEPRISRFVPLYADILRSMGIEARYVHTLRNPLEVAGSLAKRNLFTAGFSSLLWLRHELDAEKATRGDRRVFVPYEDLLADWKGAVERVGRALSIEWPQALEAQAKAIGSHLSDQHRHHTASMQTLQADTRISPWVKTAYAKLRRLQADADDAEAMEAFDRIRAGFDALGPIFGDAVHEELSQRTDMLVKAELHWRNAAQRLSDEVSHLTAETDELHRQLAEQAALAEALAEQEAALLASRQEIQRLEHARSEASQRVAALESQFQVERENLERLAAESREQTEHLRAENSRLSSDLDGREAESAAKRRELQAAAADREAEIAALKSHLDAQAVGLAELTEAREADAAQIGALAEERDRALDRCVQLQAETSAIYTSASWAVTRPLRWFTRLFS
ncbi:MAG TPA: sulfotransferase [Mesorhizobium sp.]|nr:sulfotransferase [Mesorhizobium sp.]